MEITVISKSNILTGTRTQDRFQVCGLPSCDLLPIRNSFGTGTILPTCLVSKLTEASCNVPAEANNFVPDTMLLPCLVFKLQKSFSVGLKPEQILWRCVLCSCNLLAKANIFCHDAVLLSFLVSELQVSSLLGLKPRTVLGVMTFQQSPHWKQQFWSSHHFLYV
jgi:hypothetical protein